MVDSPPDSPTAPIAIYSTQPKQQQFQQRARVHSPTPSARGPSSTRAVGYPPTGADQFPTRSTSQQHQPQRQSSSSSSNTAPPGADTSSNSISSSHSYNSINSGSQSYSGSIREVTANIVSNSILTNAVNQSIIANTTAAVAAGGMNSNNSFFSVKQSNISRGITNNMPGASLIGSPSLQQLDRTVVSINNSSSPTSSPVITRPPMSAQRTRDSSANRSHSNPGYVNTSFSSVGSAEGCYHAPMANGTSGATASSETPITPLPRDGFSGTQGSTVAVSTATGTSSPSATITSGSGVSSIPDAATPGHSSSSSVSHTHPATMSSSSSSTHSHSHSHHQHHHYHQQHNCAHSNAHTSSTGNQGHTHGRHHTQTNSGHGHAPSTVGSSTSSTPSKYRSKGDFSREAPRPSATVSPAPTPAMHWTRARVHGQIPPKELRAQTVNLVGESIYVFGGCDAKTCYNTLYIFDADTMHWSQPKTFGSIPPPCRAHSSTLVDNKRLYIFGGGDGPQYFNELYMLDTDTLTWTSPQTTGTRPCRRRAHTTCVYNNCIYVFGGGDGVQALNDTYKLNLVDMRWSEVKTTGTIPISRGYHTSNLIKSQFIVYGGSDGHECFSDVHVLDLDAKEWTKIDINRKLKRMSHTSTQVGSYLFTVGGYDGSRYSCDVVMLNLVTWSWETRKVYGLPPAGRGYHASLLYDSRLFVFGGYDGQTVYDDIYILDLSTCAYLPQITDFQILLRQANPASEDEDYDQSEDS
ncbi:hypothetical protein BGX28_006071 [Mortierella sp. GBA30]|nr:hypothetical protein BGX28_006071 [Mortierella sp. GBA30]